MANYLLDQTGAEVQAILNAVQAPDTTPVEGSTKLITSGGVQAALAGTAQELNAEVAELGQKVGKVAIPITEKNMAIYLNGGVGTQISSPVYSASFSYSRYPVAPGDVVIVNGAGGASPRLWGFVDEDGYILAVSAAYASGSGLELIAPEDAAEVIINTNVTTTPSYYISANSYEYTNNARFDTLEQRVDSIPIYDTEPPSGELYITDLWGNIIGKLNAGGWVAYGFNTPQGGLIDDDTNKFVICDGDGNIALMFKDGFSIADNVLLSLLRQKNQPALSWIDDDFNILSGSTILPVYATARQWCLDNGATMDFALIPADYSGTPDTSQRMTIAKSWEEEGFHFLLHPRHQGWADNEDYGWTHDIDAVKSGIVNTIRYFRLNNLVSDPNILVWPGFSYSYADNLAVIRNYVECAITSMADGGGNLGINNDRFFLRRFNINISSARPKSLVKKEIKNLLDDGYWVILETHLYTCSDSETIDDTTNSIANILDIVNYCNTLCPLEPTQTIWSRKKPLYDLFK